MRPTTTLPPLRWYIVHAYSNFEKKVAEEIKKQAQQHGLTELFEEVWCRPKKSSKFAAARR